METSEDVKQNEWFSPGTEYYKVPGIGKTAWRGHSLRTLLLPCISGIFEFHWFVGINICEGVKSGSMPWHSPSVIQQLSFHTHQLCNLFSAHRCQTGCSLSFLELAPWGNKQKNILIKYSLYFFNLCKRLVLLVTQPAVLLKTTPVPILWIPAVHICSNSAGDSLPEWTAFKWNEPCRYVKCKKDWFCHAWSHWDHWYRMEHQRGPSNN